MAVTQPSSEMPKRIEIDDSVLARLEANCPKYLSPTGFANLLIDQSLDKGCTLGKPSTKGEGFTSSSSTPVIKKTLTTRSFKSVPLSLQAHEDLILAFWKAKAGAKSEAAWKLLMTELTKIQDKYTDRVLREQLELAAANRWKGVSLRNYEQFGLKASNLKQDPSFDWDALDGVSFFKQ